MNKTDIPIREKPIRIKSRYAEREHTHHDNQYFLMGNNKIIINEHFKDNGKPLGIILEKVILDAEKMPKNRINT